MAHSTFVTFIRVWVGLVGITALGNTVSSYLNGELLSETIFTVQPDLVNPLVGRLFGTWTLLAAFVRVTCAIHIDSKPLYHTTLFSFMLAFAYFMSELYIYKTLDITTGPVMALIASSISFLLMLAGYTHVFPDPRRAERRPKRK